MTGFCGKSEWLLITGINDNGSGACSNLEVAIQLSKLDLHLGDVGFFT